MEGKTRLPVGSYLIPLILYAPGIVPPGVNTRLAPRLTDEAIAYYQSASRVFRMGRLRSPGYRAH